MNPTAVNETCKWTKWGEYAEQNWETECGDDMYVVSGSPKDNGYYYCPYCGGDIIQVELEE